MTAVDSSPMGRPDLRMIVRVMESFHRSRFQSLRLDLGGAVLSIRKPRQAAAAAVAATASAARSRVAVKAPSVGVFRSGSAAAGGRVEAASVLGHVDKLDVAIAVEAGAAGLLAEAAVADGAFVEHGQPLFFIEAEEGA